MFACNNQKIEKTSPDSGIHPEKLTNQKDENNPSYKTIIFFGNSLTAGYGLKPEESFPSVIQQKIDSLELEYTCINSGISGETTTGGLERLNWALQTTPDVFVLELGANDGLRGIPVELTRTNLMTIIDKVREKNPDVKIILTGMQLPPNMGEDYSAKFAQLFPEIAEEKKVQLVPFLLEGVAGEEDLNQKDGIHPTKEGAIIVANNVWKTLKTQL